MNRLFILALIAILNLHFPAQAQKFTFETVESRYGINENTVLSICRDHYGFLWIGTYNGLMRYDGYDFKIYKVEHKNIYSLRSNRIQAIIQDSRNNLWIGTDGGGLSRFDYTSGQFITYMHDKNDKNSLINNNVRTVFEDSRGTLWIGTDGGGLDKFDSENEIFIHVTQNQQKADSLRDFRIYSILETRDNQLWLGGDKGLHLLNRKTDEIVSYTNKLESTSNLSRNIIVSSCEGPDGNLWLGTFRNGLFRFNPKNEEFTHYLYGVNDENSLSHDDVKCVIMDRFHRIWVATNSGINLYDPEEDNFIIFKHKQGDNTTLSTNKIFTLYEDPESLEANLWIGTDGGGLNKLRFDRKPFRHYKHFEGDPNSLSHDFVTAIFEDPDSVGKIFWIGTINGGLNKFNRETGQFTSFKNNPNDPSSINHNEIRSICHDNQGNLWVGTAFGIAKFNKESQRFKRYIPNTGDSLSLQGNSIFVAFKDSQDNLWFGGWNIGLVNYNPSEDNFINYLPDERDPTSINSQTVWSIYEDPEESAEILWVGTHDGGLNKFDRKTGKFTRFIHIPEDSTSISDNQVLNIHKDPVSGHLWIGTASGLNLFDPEKGTFTHFNESDGLPNDIIQGVVIHNDSILWLSTQFGLSRFNTQTKRFRNYTRSDGIQGNNFFANAACKGSTGEILFGGANGFNIFYPDSIKDNPYLPKVAITDFEVLNNPVPVSTDGSTPLSKTILTTDNIVLTYKQDGVTFHFSALHLASPNANKYRYKLVNFDEDWISTAADRRIATYTNLDPGSYVFKVQAANSDGAWNQTGVSVNITVQPPWWETLWFRILSFLLIISAILGFYFYRINAYKRRQAVLEEKVKERTQRLNETNVILEERQQHIEEQAEELKANADKLGEINIRLKELNATKDKFFSIIAHDLKNPFSTILGFGELLVARYDRMDDEKKKVLLAKLYNDAKIIYELLENLLFWARSQTGKISFDPQLVNISDLIFANVSLAEGMAGKKDLYIKTELSKDLRLKLDQNMINTVIRNLITNAIKFTDEGGLTISAYADDGKVYVLIQDTGVGISEKKVKSVFDIEHSKSSKGTRGESGTGLGLIICREFVEKHQGYIWVESEEGKGSVFGFSLPKALT